MLGMEREPEALPDRCKQQDDLHHRKVVPDTLPSPTAEREVSILWQLLRALRGPSLGLERVRLVEVTRIAMSDPLEREELSSFRHLESANLRLFDRLASNRVRRRIQSH